MDEVGGRRRMGMRYLEVVVEGLAAILAVLEHVGDLRGVEVWRKTHQERRGERRGEE